MSFPVLPMPPKRDPLQLIGEQVTTFLREMKVRVERDVRLACATEAVSVSADWADSHDTTCHDCSRTSSELGEAVRKKIMEGL